ncbi:MAG: energy transducer TonB [Bacteroidota bacterium]
MLHYILQVVAFQLAFLLIYDLFLRKETFFNWNRFYLLGTAVLTLVLPFLKINSLNAITPQQFTVKLPQVVIGETQTTLDPIAADFAGITIEPEPMALWKIILYSGVFITTIIFCIKILRLLILANANPKRWQGNLLIVDLIKSNSAFSFFNYVFLGDAIRTEERKSILEHERVHVKQYHSIDLLFFELMRIAFWFNPLAYIYQNRIATLHEFIADDKATKFQNKRAYYNQLLSQVFETKSLSIVNPFFKKSLIKKRIVMLNQAKSKRRNTLKYALLIPLVAGMLFYVSCHKESLANDDPATFDLSQYSYSLKLDDKQMSKEDRVIHEAYEKFLYTHPDYVSWAVVNENKDRITYSVHGREEKVPDGFIETTVSHNDRGSYDMYMNMSYFDLGKKELMLQEVEVVDYDDATEVPFSIIDEVPTTRECADNFISNKDRKTCLSDLVAKHVATNFNTKLASQLGLQGRQRINVIFKIDTNGNIIDVRSRAPHPDLQDEAERVIKSLPSFIPGKHKGKAVVVPYSLPIEFQVGLDTESEQSNSDQDQINQNQLSEVPFSVVDEAPKFTGCEHLTDNASAQKCTSNKVAEFINTRFNTKIAKQNGLKGRQHINVIFKIDTQGNVVSIRTRASHPALEEEALRVVSNLPKFTPGKQDGQLITVPYSLPIIIQVH